jgi:NADPH2:quinone reductase
MIEKMERTKSASASYMTLTVRIEKHGGPEVLTLHEQELGEPGPDELRIRQTAIGLNFIDTYHRSGLYPLPLPSGIGSEAAGVIEGIGKNVKDFKVGDRIAYAGPIGAYAQARLVPAARAVKLPKDVDDESAAAVLLKGMTAYYLLHLTFPVQAKDILLVHAAAGGVGSLLVSWAKELGATVIGTAGGAKKCKLAKANGCDHAIDYKKQDFAAQVKEITKGRGVDVVYDSVGKDTLLKSLDCVKRRGMVVSYGNASGKPPAIEPGLLAAKGSLYFTRPTLVDYTATRSDLNNAASSLFEALSMGIVKADVRQRYPLADVAKAHADLEARKTTGATLLIP